MLQENYRAIQKEIHPDRFTTSSENEKVQSMIKSTQANDGYQTLKSPIKRAKYILSLHKSIEKNNIELARFKSTINKKYGEYFSLISTQIDDDQNWSDAAISIDKLYFIEKLLHKINSALN